MDEIDLEIPAHQVSDPSTRKHIREQYQRRWRCPVADPITQPWLYDPLDPPPGWYYDPCYEIWLKSDITT